MFTKKYIIKLEKKIDELSEKVKTISERQNSQHKEVMLALKGNVESRPIEELYEEVKDEIIELGKVSTSYIQRSQRIGYAQASRILDMLEERGIVGPSDGSKPRNVLIKSQE